MKRPIPKEIEDSIDAWFLRIYGVPARRGHTPKIFIRPETQLKTTPMKAVSKYVVFQSPKTKEWYFHLLSKNGKKVGLEGYHRKAGALKAIARFKESANLPVVIVP